MLTVGQAECFSFILKFDETAFCFQLPLLDPHEATICGDCRYGDLAADASDTARSGHRAIGESLDALRSAGDENAEINGVLEGHCAPIDDIFQPIQLGRS